MSEEIHIIEEEPIKIRGPNVIIGLPDVGLVGLIATMHMIETLKMKRVGYVESRLFPPVIVLHNGEIQSPIKLYLKYPYLRQQYMRSQKRYSNISRNGILIWLLYYMEFQFQIV